MIKIIKIETLNNDIIDFLVNESYNLYCDLRKHNNLVDSVSKKLKEKLRNMYNDYNNNQEKIYAAYKENLVIGCASITKEGYIRDLFVKKNYRGQGIGSLLLESIILDNIESVDITLNTYPSMVEFYKKHSFYISDENQNSIKMELKSMIIKKK